MAIPFLAVAQAISTLVPLFNKSLSEKAEAKKVLAANNGTITSSIGQLAIGESVVALTQSASLEEAITAVVTSIIGLLLYLCQNHES